jgi:hypothetical protein
MRIGVQEAVHHHHPEIDDRQRLHHTPEGEPARLEVLVQAVDLRSVAVLHDEHPPAGILVVDAGRAHGAIPREDAPEVRDVVGLPLEVHLLAHPHRELTHDRGQRAHVVVRKQDVEPEEEAERDVEVDRDQRLDPRAEDLDDHVLAIDASLVDLAEARGGDRLVVELLEDVGGRSAELPLDDLADLVRRVGRNVIL